MIPLILMVLVILAFASIAGRFAYKINVGRKGYWILAGYAAILVVYVIVYLFIPKEQFHAVEEFSNQDSRVEIVHHVAYGDKSIEDFETYAVKDWTTEVAMDRELNLIIDSQDFHIPLLIKEVSDATAIEARLYHVESKFEFEGLENGPKQIELTYWDEQGDLMIVTPETRYLEYASIAKEFPFTQLSSTEAEEYDYFRLDFYSEEMVIYLEVPEELEITFDYDIYHEYID